MAVGNLRLKYPVFDVLRPALEQTQELAELFFGLLLYLSDRFKLEKNISNDFNLKSVFFILKDEELIYVKLLDN